MQCDVISIFLMKMMFLEDGLIGKKCPDTNLTVNLDRKADRLVPLALIAFFLEGSII